MRLSFEFDLLSRLRRNKPTVNEQRSMSDVNVISPFMGIFGRNTKAGVGITEEGSLGLSAVYAAITRVETKLDNVTQTVNEHDEVIGELQKKWWSGVGAFFLAVGLWLKQLVGG